MSTGSQDGNHREGISRVGWVRMGTNLQQPEMACDGVATTERSEKPRKFGAGAGDTTGGVDVERSGSCDDKQHYRTVEKRELHTVGRSVESGRKDKATRGDRSSKEDGVIRRVQNFVGWEVFYNGGNAGGRGSNHRSTQRLETGGDPQATGHDERGGEGETRFTTSGVAGAADEFSAGRDATKPASVCDVGGTDAPTTGTRQLRGACATTIADRGGDNGFGGGKEMHQRVICTIMLLTKMASSLSHLKSVDELVEYVMRKGTGDWLPTLHDPLEEERIVREWTEWMQINTRRACGTIGFKRGLVMRMMATKRGSVVCRMGFESTNDWCAVSSVSWLYGELTKMGITAEERLMVVHGINENEYFLEATWNAKRLDELQVGFNMQVMVACGCTLLTGLTGACIDAAIHEINALSLDVVISKCGSLKGAVRLMDALTSWATNKRGVHLGHIESSVAHRLARAAKERLFAQTDHLYKIRMCKSTLESASSQLIASLRELWLPPVHTRVVGSTEPAPIGRSIRKTNRYSGIVLRAMSCPFDESMFRKLCGQERRELVGRLDSTVGARALFLSGVIPMARFGAPKADTCYWAATRKERAVMLIQSWWRRGSASFDISRCISPSMAHPCHVQRAPVSMSFKKPTNVSKRPSYDFIDDLCASVTIVQKMQKIGKRRQYQE